MDTLCLCLYLCLYLGMPVPPSASEAVLDKFNGVCVVHGGWGGSGIIGTTAVVCRGGATSGDN
jgi:hypothetical protein